MRNQLILSSFIASFAIAGCAADVADPAAGPGGETLEVPDSDLVKTEFGKDDSSVEAVIVDFEFEGSVWVDSSWGLEKKIEDQMLYTIGQLNGDRAVGRLDQLVLSDVERTADGDGYLVTYKARLPVAWGRRNDVPTNYTLMLPRDGSYKGKQAFTEAYKHDCVDWGAHDVDTGSMWYYYRPDRSRCSIKDEDVVKLNATVTVSEVNTTGKYPEYHKVWEDDKLEVVAVFGKYEDGKTSNTDAGISAYNNFVSTMKSEFKDEGVTTLPADVPNVPGVDHPDVTFSVALPDGKSVEIVALLVDNVRTAGQTFNDRYAGLTETADLIAYNGHAGLGSNIRALASKGKWATGQYAMVFMNGCDTYAYVDDALDKAHAAVNDDDDVDLLSNALPSFFRSMSAATTALVRGLMSYDDPQTYEQIFKKVDSSQVIIVTGEQDNEFFPGWPGDDTDPVVWSGLSEGGAVARNEEARFETPKLEAGKYRFAITGDGDADLYVRIGDAPTATSYDCRPYRWGSNEVCEIELTAPAPVHVMVRGYDPSSSYELLGAKQ